MIRITQTQRPPYAAKIAKNINFGVARALTQTAKQGQTTVIPALRGSFTLRGAWWKQSSKFGIRVKPATPARLTAEVYSAADWIEKQRKGGHLSGSSKGRMFRYTYKGVRYIAEPSRALRPKRSTKVLRRTVWPSTLRRKKGTFVIDTGKTPLLMSRFAEGKEGVEVMYILRPDTSIKPEDAFYTPIDKVVKDRLGYNIRTSIYKALLTMK